MMSAIHRRLYRTLFGMPPRHRRPSRIGRAGAVMGAVLSILALGQESLLASSTCSFNGRLSLSACPGNSGAATGAVFARIPLDVRPNRVERSSALQAASIFTRSACSRDSQWIGIGLDARPKIGNLLRMQQGNFIEKPGQQFLGSPQRHLITGLPLRVGLLAWSFPSVVNREAQLLADFHHTGEQCVVAVAKGNLPDPKTALRASWPAVAEKAYATFPVNERGKISALLTQSLYAHGKAKVCQV